MRTLTVAQKRSRLEAVWAESAYRKYGDGEEGFIAWCKELYYVRNKMDSRGRSLFDLYPFQEEAAHDYFNNKYVVALKARQMGFTTLGMAFALWKSIYKPGGATVLVLSKTQVDARANMQMVKHALSYFPDWYSARMPQIEAESNDRLVLRHRDGSMSVLEAMVATERSGASRTADLVVADEAALWAKPDDTMRSISPATDAAAASSDNEAVMLVFSTARGGANYFANLWRDAHAGRNNYKALFYPWHVNPLSNPKALEGEVDYSVVNARKSEFASEPHKFFSEYPSTPEEAFKSSGHSRFQDLPGVMEFEDFPFRGTLVSTGTHATWLDDLQGDLYLNFDPRDKDAHPAQSKQIFIGADPALGVGGDSSVAYVMAHNGVGAMEIVGYYHSNQIEPVDFADVLWDMGWFFANATRGALIACENQPSGGGGGQTVVGRLRDRGYHQLYQYVQPAARGRKAMSFYGMPITKGTKPLLINTLAEWLSKDELTGEMQISNIPPILRDELGTFVVKPNGTTSADTGCHDDHVLAAAIACYVAATSTRNPTPRRSSQEQETSDEGYVLRLDLSQMRKNIDKQVAESQRRKARDIRRAKRAFRRR